MTAVTTASRPCLVCHERTTTEGQLCHTCVEAGHRVENDTVLLNIEIRY